ncbi:phosphate ABC transporter substrate-binding protein PstS family protein [Vagococcus carniphilus]|uniref:Phosphate-binding protein n=1 Tax=Vagococcus carniphilus TaxID=218144 RepID=A0AAW8U5V4_9ENTE|nr:phosphate ABC transporter substrate-binding protein PstS family protein [Vagococcus carniphilus]MDT2815538.1 phosphate ABC transporter substrate-binding protein PstS family protein [Vagococcus carniphilus]MDT2830828.1 phosphate ABC transporter substrate-binding protein PstS family protein [Vagococcus carniphilus]MDT2834479.1 phosphate ABC transporter substrate-binding protein PstS family protein [Vagococcus carniphilus]MDT2839400.1 phosphate ABC transporter substrate-binding protein PstS fam
MRKVYKSACLFALTFVIASCGKVDNGESINAVGSSAMQPLVEAASEQYSSTNLGKFINVQGGGSGTGLSQVQAGAVEIGNSDLFAEEKDGIKSEDLVDHQVAVVGLTPIVNKKVGIKDISKEDLKKIFTGKIKNWKEVGGKDQEIVLLNRASGSGSRHTFEQWVLDGEESKNAQEQESTGMVRQIVSTTPGAISYVAFSYVTDEVATLSIDGVKPTEENVMKNDWFVWSYEHMYTKGDPKGLTKEFLEYMVSEDVQKEIVPQLGYIPVSEMTIDRDVKGNVKPK